MKSNIYFLLVTFLMLISLGTTASAQQTPNWVFKKGQIEASFEIGLVPTFLIDNGKSNLPPFGLKLDCLVTHNFSLGIIMGYSSFIYETNTFHTGQDRRFQNRFLFSGIGGTLHRNISDNWEIYGGGRFGYNLTNISLISGEFGALKDNLGVKTWAGNVTWTGFVGIRHAFNKKMSLYGEIGYGVSLFNVGFGFRLK